MTLASLEYVQKYHPFAKIVEKDNAHRRIVGVVDGQSMSAVSGAELS
jgi:adenosine/AMP kinase